MLETALLEDGDGKPLLTGKLNGSREWSAVNAFCNRTYMPLSTRPPRAAPIPMRPCAC